MLMSSFWALHRDEKVWQDAEAFLPERWLDSSPKAVEQRNASWKAFGACCCGRADSLLQVQKHVRCKWRLRTLSAGLGHWG